MQHASLTPDETIFDPEFVVTRARRDTAALRVLLAPAPFSVHRPRLDARDHPDVALRRPRQGGRDLQAHGLASLRDDLAGIVRRIFVIQTGHPLEIARVERLKPSSDEVERIGRHALRYFTCMKAHTKYLTLNIPSKMSFRNITPDVDDAVRASGVQEGLVLVNTMHITASVFINDNERGLHHDFGKWLEELAPFNPDPDHYHHNRTGEDNADAHLKRQIMGREVVVAITRGKLDFGPWEQIFYGEFDGNRNKRVLIKVIGE